MFWWHVLSGSWPFKSQNGPKNLWQVCPMIPPAVHPQQTRDKNWDDGRSFSYSCHLSYIWTKLRVKSYLLVGGFNKNPHICPSNWMIPSLLSVTIYEKNNFETTAYRSANCFQRLVLINHCICFYGLVEMDHQAGTSNYRACRKSFCICAGELVLEVNAWQYVTHVQSHRPREICRDFWDW